ncbi:MAG: hypothetical protein WCT03_23690 [Candidatus Obscuribacterales bacterium]|jgi:hypothetical protein
MSAPYIVPLAFVALIVSTCGLTEAGLQPAIEQFNSPGKVGILKLDDKKRDRYDEPETQNPYGASPRGPDPHGDNPHDEQHDKNLPANNPDKYLR